MITGRDFAQSFEGNYEDERLFSTGNDELDGILEEVYYSGIEDGYDYAQKEFAQINSKAVKAAWNKFKKLTPEQIDALAKGAGEKIKKDTKPLRSMMNAYEQSFKAIKDEAGRVGGYAESAIKGSKPYIQKAQEVAKDVEPMVKKTKKEVGAWAKAKRQAANKKFGKIGKDLENSGLI